MSSVEQTEDSYSCHDDALEFLAIISIKTHENPGFLRLNRLNNSACHKNTLHLKL